jgi:hypothetical protein
LTQISINASDKFKYELPKIIDPENDNVQTVVKLGFASEFSSIVSENLIFYPKPNNNGTYSIEVILTDSY